ncbi:RNA 2',3'-cyclic phosphodiesterase [Frankia sp. Cppng1_Ct_nod]|uniref:RNA 2',3'-cyclic phosphodiesterase n=1 Tax=Frankia sp. Cppng1_Ct_nod TaxID=2897162 RepID=UPI002024887A|nr:RNA 2',3'-cyclic phosphodiesterase [Frankia sp. Cppng1_Ct_nod]
MVRLFVALIPPVEVVEPLRGAVERLRAEHPRPAAALRWTPPESWHITLAFLGEVADTVGPELIRRLAEVARRHPPVAVTIAGGGCFSTRVLFAGIGEAPLAPLAATVAREARRAGADRIDDTRPWRGHLTLATRGLSRAGGRHAPSPSPDATETLTPMVDALATMSCRPWTATEFTLMRSGSTPQRQYERVATWTLSGIPD